MGLQYDWDYFNSMSNAAGQDLTWFFNNWFFSNGYIDLALTSGASSIQGTTITVQNVGGFAVPVDLKITYVDGSTDTLHRSPAVWQANPQQAVITVPYGKVVRSVALDHGIYLDANPKDDTLMGTKISASY